MGLSNLPPGVTNSDIEAQCAENMTYNEALGIVITAAEVRADQWRQAEQGEFDCIDELHEAGVDECGHMANLIDQALIVLRG